jgi:hypothetical protein
LLASDLIPIEEDLKALGFAELDHHFIAVIFELGIAKPHRRCGGGWIKRSRPLTLAISLVYHPPVSRRRQVNA